MKSIEIDKLVIKDVNNILYRSIDGNIKATGVFEYDKDYQKSQSNKIIAIALNKYFLEDVPIETTITKHDNIFDFCLIKKFKKGLHGELHSIKDGSMIRESLQKFNRYVVSKTGKYLNQVNIKNKIALELPERITVANDINDVSFDDIDYNYYIRETNKIRNAIVQKTINMF